MGELNPIYWALAWPPGKAWKVGWVFVLGIAYWLWGFAQFERDFVNEGNYLVTLFVMQLVIKCWVGLEAAGRLGGDRQSGAMELLLCTPIRVREMIAGHFQAFHWQFLWPLLIVLLVNVIFLLEPISTRWGAADPGSRYWVRMLVANMVLFVLDVYALSWLGLWRGFNSRSSVRAAVSSMVLVLLVPWVAFILFTVGTALLESFTRRGVSGADEMTFLAVWFFIGAFSSVTWLLRSRAQLLQQVRRLAPFQVGDTRARASQGEVKDESGSLVRS